ncbi:hypothetical protein NIES2109_16900 [Nostoc sp. HK-01]|uniref:Na+-translocating membrane potential-generating system MpsC domain-containing protein n=2 Tax=Nostocales TaxID=1161 RepID=A0A1Z4GHY8_9CYAN|nr:DUF2294 domain-containing protein [Nostoc cycadae]BAY16988.1 hypothetical protein NIES21_28220 [Anabaenopsis circularis NIES-21]BBD58911.1 hypothetical protein NIES2109_16900 [Nostoc sp. HK-01]GBE91941.1 hypothetical protein NCWK1_1694 [Nostoc cycadae WK-1]
MSYPTIGQLEREIAQRISALYYEQLGQRPSQVVCHFFDTELVISLEKSASPVEVTLISGGYGNLAEQVRLFLDKIIKPHLQNLIEEIIGKPILDLMTNTNLATGRTGIIVVLQQLPEVRNPESIPKANWKNLTE